MVEKLTIRNLDNHGTITCQFNPNELSLSKSNRWEPKTHGGSKLPTIEFKGEGLRTVQLSLTFDTYEDGSKAVTDKTDKVLEFMRADVTEAARNSRNRQSRPPHLELQWGQKTWMRVVLAECSEKYTLFAADGTPVRATLQLKFQEVPDPNRTTGQNPTSRAAGARRVRMVQPGDTLDWIAADELGDPCAWRVLAEANALDDPRRLQPGQYLIIPSEA